MKPESVIKNAKLALSNRLFIGGWCLNEDLHNAIKKPQEYDVILHKENGIPIAVLVANRKYSRPGNVQIAIFVKKAYRNKGIGSKLVTKMKRKAPGINLEARIGIKGSLDFWSKMKVERSY